jgi:hypothetical protein
MVLLKMLNMVMVTALVMAMVMAMDMVIINRFLSVNLKAFVFL